MTQVTKDIAFIFLVFAFCALLVYGAVVGSWPPELGVQPGRGHDDKLLTADQFRDQFQTWAVIVALISLCSTLAWYITGELGPRSGSSGGGWLLFWLFLLLIVAAAVIVASFWGPPTSDNGAILGGFFAVIGLVFFYIATALFSPTNTKFVVPGSKALRKGW